MSEILTQDEIRQGIIEKIPRGNCAYCSCPIFRRLKRMGKNGKRGQIIPLPDDEATRDHVIPRSRGGHGLENNTVICCHKCNRDKGDQLLSEWLTPDY